MKALVSHPFAMKLRKDGPPNLTDGDRTGRRSLVVASPHIPRQDTVTLVSFCEPSEGVVALT
jgi:hypothetical protein